jgi:hypothetical protein
MAIEHRAVKFLCLTPFFLALVAAAGTHTHGMHQQESHTELFCNITKVVNSSDKEVFFYFRNETDVVGVKLGDFLSSSLPRDEQDPSPPTVLVGALEQPPSSNGSTLLRFPEVSVDCSVEDRKQAFKHIVSLLAGNRTRVRNSHLLNLLKIADWFSYEFIVEEAAKAILSNSVIDQYFRSRRPIPARPNSVVSARLASFISFVKEHPPVIKHGVIPTIASTIREFCAEEDVTESGWKTQWILRLSQLLDITSDTIADIFISECPQLLSIFSEQKDSWFENTSRSRKGWIQFLLQSKDSAKKKESIASAVPTFIRNGHVELLKLLLNNVCHVVSVFGFTANHALLQTSYESSAALNEGLQHAAFSGDVEAAVLMLHSGADVHSDNDNALRLASRRGFCELVQLLLLHGADVHAGNEEALYLAAANGHRKTVEVLLKSGAVVQPRMRREARRGLHFLTLEMLESTAPGESRLLDIAAWFVLTMLFEAF